MGFVDKFKGMFMSLDEEYDEEIEYDEEPLQEEVRPPVKKFEFDNNTDGISANEERRSGKVVKMNTSNNSSHTQVVLVKPEQFEEARDIANYLNDKKTVVLNLESASKEVARRLVDILTGVAYANGGKVRRIATSTFLITSDNVEIDGELIDEYENNGVYF